MCCDLQNSKLSAVRVKGLAQDLGEEAVDSAEDDVERRDNLAAEIADFIGCCRSGAAPTVTGDMARDALAVVQQIEAALADGAAAPTKEYSRVAS